MKRIQQQIEKNLGIEVLPIKYEDIGKDDSRPYVREGYVAINIKYKGNELETIKSIAYE